MSKTQEHFELANLAFAVGDIEVFRKYFPTLDEYNHYSGLGEKSTYLLPALFFPQYWNYVISEGYDLLKIFAGHEPYFLLSDELIEKIFKSNPKILKDIFETIHPFVEDDTPITDESLDENDVNYTMSDFYHISDENKDITLDYFSGNLQNDIETQMNHFLYSTQFYRTTLFKLSALFPQK